MFGIHVGQPLGRARAFAGDGGMEGFLDLAGNGAHAPDADGAEVHLADGDALGGRAAHEQLIGDVKLVARNGLLKRFDAQVGAQGQDGMARDAFQDGRGEGCDDLAVAHDERFSPVHSPT